MKISLMSAFGCALCLFGSVALFAQPKNTLVEEEICKKIGFRPKTEAFGVCVLELVDRNIPTSTASKPSAAKPPRDLLAEDARYQRRADAKRARAGGMQTTSAAKPPRDLLAEDAKYQRQANARRARIPAMQTTSAQAPAPVMSAAREVALTTPLSSNEQTCASYGFKRGTQAFGQCLMQLDQIQQQAMLAERQHQLQLAQYQQQVAAYEEQQRAIKKEKDRRKWEAIGRLGAGMANSTSPSFLGALNEGLAAANGYPIAKPPALPPSPPAIQNYTIRGPNGDQIYCSYNTAARYMNCR